MRNPWVNLPALIFSIGCFVNLIILVRSNISLYLLIRNGRKITTDYCTIVLEQVTRSESTTNTPTNQNYTLEFFEAKLNKYISEHGGSASLSSEEMRSLLTEKTNIFSLLVNFKNEILFANALCPIEQLSSELTKKLAADYPNKKPVFIIMQADLGTSDEVKTEILNIVGRAFVEHQNSEKQKNQPVLLQYEIPKQYSPKSVSGNKPKTR